VKDEDLLVQNALLRQLLVEAGLHAAEQDLAGKLQRLISEELHHRVQNTLATVQAIVSQTLRTANNMEEAQGAIEQRLRSLGRVHDLLLRTSWVQANLHAILIAATQPFRTNEAAQFQIDCPRNLVVAAGAALPTAMVLNELCTNATKYGALSIPEGRVHITAEVDESRKAARLTWRESGGPLVKLPTRRSFGSRLIEQSLLADTRGKGRIQFLPGGVVCELEVMLLEQPVLPGIA
jgi:two-component sensor histidine kinase